MQRETFQFHREWWEAVQDCPKSVQLKFYHAIMTYALTGEVPALQPMMQLAFNLVRGVIDREGREDVENSADDAMYIEADDAMCAEREETESKQEKEKCPPDPLTKEKEIKKEKEAKENPLIVGEKKEKSKGRRKALNESKETLGERKEKFREEVFIFAGQYPEEMLTKFFSYWSEANRTGRKMRCELEKTWETHRRLQNWASRDTMYSSRMLSAVPMSGNAFTGTSSTREQRDREAAAIMQRFLAESAAGTAYPNAPF